MCFSIRFHRGGGVRDDFRGARQRRQSGACKVQAEAESVGAGPRRRRQRPPQRRLPDALGQLGRLQGGGAGRHDARPGDAARLRRALARRQHAPTRAQAVLLELLQGVPDLRRLHRSELLPLLFST